MQILTGVAHYLGGSFVEFSDSVGQGVHFGDDIMGFRMMLQSKATLNGRRCFIKIWKGSIADHEVGHLVCEARQHIWSRMRRAAFAKFVVDITAKRIEHKSSRRERKARKRRFCETIAEYALNT